MKPFFYMPKAALLCAALAGCGRVQVKPDFKPHNTVTSYQPSYNPDQIKRDARSIADWLEHHGEKKTGVAQECEEVLASGCFSPISVPYTSHSFSWEKNGIKYLVYFEILKRPGQEQSERLGVTAHTTASRGKRAHERELVFPIIYSEHTYGAREAVFGDAARIIDFGLDGVGKYGFQGEAMGGAGLKLGRERYTVWDIPSDVVKADIMNQVYQTLLKQITAFQRGTGEQIIHVRDRQRD